MTNSAKPRSSAALNEFIQIYMKYVGRRGTSLLVFASLLGLTGYQYLFYTPTWMLLDNLKFPLSIMPLQFWGVLFFVVAIIGIVGAFRKSSETLAFSALSCWNALWAVLYLLGSITGHDHGGGTRIVYYFLCAWFILMLNGWAEVHIKK